MAGRQDAGAATEPPTEARRRQARQAGQVAVSRDLTGAVALMAVVVVLAAGAPAGVGQVLRAFQAALGGAFAAGKHGSDRASLEGALGTAVATALPLILVPSLAALAAAVLVGALQTGGLFSWEAARPSMARGRRGGWLGRVVRADAAGRALAKLALVTAVVAIVAGSLLPVLPGLTRVPATDVLRATGTLALRLAMPLTAAMVAWGVLDWTLARWRHRRALAMTRDEVRRELREREGDPARRAERRHTHRALAESAAPEDTRSATLVVWGPGPVAVALEYDRAGGRAPVVAVAGHDAVAEQILSVARAAAVRVAEDAALAATLVEVRVGDEIPESCFEAVAALLP